MTSEFVQSKLAELRGNRDRTLDITDIRGQNFEHWKTGEVKQGDYRTESAIFFVNDPTEYDANDWRVSFIKQ
jgi:hypothetical protein